MEFRVLGPIEVWRDGEPVAIDSFRQRTLLALLLVHPNQVVSTDRIIDELWGDDLAEDRINALWVHISHLRSALEPGREKRSEGSFLLTRAPGYLLQVQPEELDARRFDRLLDESRGLIEYDPAAASLVAAEGLALWRGRPYEDVAYESFAQAEIAALDERRMEAVELRVDADLRRGLANELVAELEALTRQHPLRERITALLMVALYRSGRRAEALRAYRRLRSRLVEEIGIDPSPALQALEQQILTSDPALEHGDATAGAPTRLAVRGYELRGAIGEGRSGQTYRAYQPVVGREVAIKITRRDVANDPDFIRRFESDAEMVARLEHPHIVPLYDFWREPDAAYLVTRLFRGGNLEIAVGAAPLDAAAGGELVSDLGSVLALAHRHGVVHGNVKPSNVLLDGEGGAYLTDFGTVLGHGAASGGPPPSSSPFAAPEQRAGEPATPRSDIYSLAAVLAYSLTGRSPGNLPDGLAGLPPPIREAITRATSVDPAARPADVSSFVQAARSALGAGAAPPAPVRAENPYKGLRAFDEADAGMFFGRERQVERLLARLGDSGPRGRFVAVVGPSGSGKSSVVHAGLVPALRRDAIPGSSRWFIVSMTPDRQPFEALETALLGIAASPSPDLLEELTSGEAGIARAVREVLSDPHEPLVLVIDQFEELFTQTPEGTARAFLDALATAVGEARSRLRVVVTLRADFYDRPLGHRRIGELLRLGTEVITPMGPEGLERAITVPAERAGVRFEAGLVAEIVADVAGRQGALPLLQYTLTELYDTRRGQTIEIGSYREAGAVSGALARRAEAIFAALDLPARDMTRQVFLRLVALGDGAEVARRRVLRQELTALDGAAVGAVLDTFGRHRLLTFDRDTTTRGPTVEIAHEALLEEWGRLATWIEDGRVDLQQHRRLAAAAAEWEHAAQDPAYLLRGSQLEQMAGWATATDLTINPDEQAFLDASTTRRDSERAAEDQRRRAENQLRQKARQRTRLLVGGGIVMAVVVALAAFAVVQRNDASRLAGELAATDEARRLAAASASVADDDPELATLLALQAIETSRTGGIPALAEAEDALQWAIQAKRLTYPVAEAPVEARIGPSGLTGTFRLPMTELIGLTRENLSRTFTTDECERYRIDRCPSDGSGLASPAGEGPRAVPAEPVPASVPASTTPLAGTTVTVLGPQPPESGLGNELARFQELTGIEVDYSFNLDLEFEARRLLEAGRTPDIAIWPQPALIRELARQQELVDIGAYLDSGSARAAFGDYLVDAVSEDGGMFGLPLRLDLKGLVWYPKTAFLDAGYTAPTTWAELVALTEQMVADGREPWCIGFESGEFSGWPGTDWVEALVLRLSGVETYDRWIDHQIPFTAPAVRDAVALFGDIAFGEGFVRGGSESISRRDYLGAFDPMLEAEPGCWLYHQASFLPHALPPEVQVGVDFDFFPLPPMQAGQRTPGFGGGLFAAAFSDRPEVRELMRRLTSPEWGAAWSEAPNSDFLPANVGFDPESCRSAGVEPANNETRVRLCQASRDAIAGGLWRFDASDLMPLEIGSAEGAFLDGMVDYVDSGPASLDQILAEIESAWP